MDLHWRRARMRKWIAVGDQLGLTQKEIAAKASVTTRTVRRWCKAVRVLQADAAAAALDAPSQQMPARQTGHVDGYSALLNF